MLRLAWSCMVGAVLACLVADFGFGQDGSDSPTWPISIEARIGGPEVPGGGLIQCDLPGELHRRNTESKGLGLCVFTSIHHAAVWQNVPQLVEFPKFLIDKGIPGGGYPSKVTALVKQISEARGLPVPSYLQVENADMEVLKAACRSGRMPGVTYGISATGRYNGEPIAHMVSLVHADDQWFVVLDNNYPGSRNYEWLSPQEFLRAYCTEPGALRRPVNTGKGWSVILLAPPPPPPPTPQE